MHENGKPAQQDAGHSVANTTDVSQPSLFDSIQPADTDRPLTLAERFEAFDEANPHINNLLVRLARDWKTRTGRDRLGIAALWERMRWELSVQTNETPVLNNDFKAFFARKIMREHPDLDGLFEIRRSAADRWIGTVGDDNGQAAA